MASLSVPLVSVIIVQTYRKTHEGVLEEVSKYAPLLFTRW